MSTCHRRRHCHVAHLGACALLTSTAALWPARLLPLQVCRCLPWVLKNYRLEELTSVGELRRNVSSMFRKYADVSTPEVVDLLVYKGREELEVGAAGRRRRGLGSSDGETEAWVGRQGDEG